MTSEFQLDGIVPWGRSAAEYEAFFGLSDLPPLARVLDCGAGPSSFAAELGARGQSVVAVDPRYDRPIERIAGEFESVAVRMLNGMRAARGRFRWDYYGSPELVVERRRKALATFVEDFEGPVRAGRYVAGRLPVLPFAPASFDLVLCSHLLFLYSEELRYEAHVAALEEMLRVGREVRVFPLIDLQGRPSQHVSSVVEHFQDQACCELVPVSFEFQLGASTMLRLAKSRVPCPGSV